MTTFYVTFNLKWATEQHPRFKDAHPEGWLEVEAPNELTARLLTIEHIGRAWAFIYDERTWANVNEHLANPMGAPLFPRGCLGRISAEHGLVRA